MKVVDKTMKLENMVYLTDCLQFDERHLRNSFCSKRNRKILRNLFFRFTMDKKLNQVHEYGLWVNFKYFRDHQWHDDIDYVVLFMSDTELQSKITYCDDKSMAQAVIELGYKPFTKAHWGFTMFVYDLFHEIGHFFMERKAPDMIENDTKTHTYDETFYHSKRLDEKLADLFAIICIGDVPSFVNHFRDSYQCIIDECDPSMKEPIIAELEERTSNFIKLFQDHPEMASKYKIKVA